MTDVAPSTGPQGDRVLIVDDDAGMRETLVDILGLHGIQATAVGSAAAATASNAASAAAVAVVDQRLPDTTGVELSAALKARDPDLQVVMLTGYPTVESAIAAVGQADEFLTKPIAPDELVRVVKAALARHRLRRENTELLIRLGEANSRLEASIAERTRDLEGLESLAESIALTQGVDQVLEAVVRTSADAAGADAAAIYLEDPITGVLDLRTAWPSSGRLPLTIPRDGPADGERTVGVGGASTMRADLLVGGQRLGALLVVNPERTSVSFLRTVAVEAAVSIQNAQRFDRERETVERLSELSRLKSTFLASVSHELRTPLTALVGFAQTLGTYSDTLSAADREHMLNRMVSQGERLGRLINNLLDSTSLETGSLRLSVGPVEPLAVVERVVDSLPEERPPVEVVVAPDLPPVRADEGRLEQVLGNLLENAVKYSPEDPVTISADAVDDSVTFRVADRGPGMEPSFLERAFEPFSQADTGDGRFDKGVGLGLYIVRGLVEAMGGTIGVESQVGTGTTFSITLPRAAA
ncbi:MAG: response regulator [Actinobacteria bacterium]|nr:response regulator [Actinomycetota bacterium]MBV9662680.1 response regulator [Actinomycetota bacterium]